MWLFHRKSPRQTRSTLVHFSIFLWCFDTLEYLKNLSFPSLAAFKQPLFFGVAWWKFEAWAKSGQNLQYAKLFRSERTSENVCTGWSLLLLFSTLLISRSDNFLFIKIGKNGFWAKMIFDGEKKKKKSFFPLKTKSSFYQVTFSKKTFLVFFQRSRKPQSNPPFMNLRRNE